MLTTFLKTLGQTLISPSGFRGRPGESPLKVFAALPFRCCFRNTAFGVKPQRDGHSSRILPGLVALAWKHLLFIVVLSTMLLLQVTMVPKFILFRIWSGSMPLESQDRQRVQVCRAQCTFSGGQNCNAAPVPESSEASVSSALTGLAPQYNSGIPYGEYVPRFPACCEVSANGYKVLKRGSVVLGVAGDRTAIEYCKACKSGG